MSFFDLRRPLGWLFLILGILLEIAGLHPAPTSEGISPGVNINLLWGAVMVAFGLICLWLAHRQKRKHRHANPTASRENL
ncbi:conserved hypothetical protein [Chthoniobacter flavus Ellin428]|uniref:Uncharacterized protein n=1 Tax=Chthoniobacter flavus Ellin428 TaxID=497964 RepID=B4DAD3_9BACT|nr:hypothetical protein [Chthoniobacter flavus]EDY16594.1 conserved hypothetical protein [Chthoniobacter flavus Ellin428]TCO91984.1 hypothetical protein EV701_107266 [Chthoniobacter flavus]